MRGLFISLIFCLGQLCHAWDAKGHEVIVQIALDHCKESTQHWVKDMLQGAHWTGHDYTNPLAAARLPDDILDSEWSHGHPFQGDSLTYVEFHWINRELNGAVLHPRGPGDVIQGVDQAKRRLQGDPSVSAFPAGKQEALIFLLHFVGDAHQPLHCIDNLDTGGHYNITLPGSHGGTIFCHKWWDDEPAKFPAVSVGLRPVIAIRGSGQTDVEKEASAETIEACAKALYDKYGPEFLESEMNNLSVSAWVKESYDYAHDFVYPVGDHPSPTDIEKWKEEAYRRATLAGIRLGKLLDTLASHS